MRDLTREQLLAELRALRPEFERRGVTHMAMFGSRARGDHRPDSDIDLVVDIEDGKKFSLLDAIGVAHVVEDTVGLETGVVVLDPHTDHTFAAAVRRDRVAVY
jgi:predicted nucleotidyltransferase